MLVNFPHAEKLVNDLEVLRGGLLDVVELRGGDQWRGTLKESAYKLDTFCGPIELPADQVVSMMTVGSFRPTQLFVTADGEVFGGILQGDSIKLQLTSGQVTSIPLHSVTRLGYRKRPGEPEEWKFDKPTAYLRDGQRIGVQLPAEPVPVATIYGPLQLRPESIAALVFQGEDQPVHQVQLADGSRFAGLVGKESFDLKIRNPAVATAPPGGARPSRLRLHPPPRLRLPAPPARFRCRPWARRAGRPCRARGSRRWPRSVNFPTAGLARLQFSAPPTSRARKRPRSPSPTATCSSARSAASWSCRPASTRSASTAPRSAACATPSRPKPAPGAGGRRPPPRRPKSRSPSGTTPRSAAGSRAIPSPSRSSAARR